MCYGLTESKDRKRLILKSDKKKKCPHCGKEISNEFDFSKEWIQTFCSAAIIYVPYEKLWQHEVPVSDMPQFESEGKTKVEVVVLPYVV